MRKIDRKTADPEILAAYEQLRFERRYPMLAMVINAFRVIAYLSILPILFLPAGMRPTAFYAWFAVVSAALTMELVLLIAWQPAGRRLKAFGLIIAFFAVVGVIAAAFFYGMERWLGSLG